MSFKEIWKERRRIGFDAVMFVILKSVSIKKERENINDFFSGNIMYIYFVF